MTQKLEFIGKNIRLLRRSRNWTLSELATRIGMHKGPLGRIERGLNLPSAKVIFGIATEFNVPVDTLFEPETHRKPVKGSNASETSFISLEPEAGPPPKTLLKACIDVMAAYTNLEDICKVRKHAYLPFILPFTPTWNGMEDLADRVRGYMNTGDAIIYDYFELFENAGMRVVTFPFTRGAVQMDSISFYESEFHNAFFFINAKRNPEKQIFSLAAELGKIMVSNQLRLQRRILYGQEKDMTDFLEGDRPITPERAANRFAATFLMPGNAVRATVTQLGISRQGWSWDLLIRIKHRFGVSAQAFLYRLHEMDLIAGSQKEQLDNRITEFYESHRHREPGSSRRRLTPNGRFYDLLMAADNIKTSEKEVADIKRMVKKLKILPK